MSDSPFEGGARRRGMFLLNLMTLPLWSPKLNPSPLRGPSLDKGRSFASETKMGDHKGRPYANYHPKHYHTWI